MPTIQKGTGIVYTNGVPTHKPNFATHSRFAIDEVNYKLYVYNSSIDEWVEVGAQGPPGPQGPPGGTAVTYPAGEAIAAGRAVIIDGAEVFHFQPANDAHYGRLCGVSLNIANVGQNVSVQMIGEAELTAFAAFADSTIYAGANGVLQTTIPASGIIQSVGVGTGTNKIKLDFSTKIRR